MGGNIKKGAKSIPIVYRNVTDREVVNRNTGNSEVESIPFMKYYRYSAFHRRRVLRGIFQPNGTIRRIAPVKI